MKSRTIQGVKIAKGQGKQRNQLAPLKPVLDEWLKLVGEYSEFFPGFDSCYWYNERANAGMLAAAAWRTGSGWIALEEFPTDKKDEYGEDKDGRCDLYLGRRISKDNSETFALEAKLVWPDVLSDKRELSLGIPDIRAKMLDAWKDVGKLKKDEADIRVAACFLVPRFSDESEISDQEKFDLLVAKWVASIKENLNPDAVAWVFPKESRSLKIAKEKWYYPGVCLLLKDRQRANKVPKLKVSSRGNRGESGKHRSGR